MPERLFYRFDTAPFLFVFERLVVNVFFHVVRNIDDVPAAFNVVVMLAHERLIDIVQKFAIEVEIEDREERRKNDREDTDDLENEFHSVHLFLTRSGCHRSRAATGREALRA